DRLRGLRGFAEHLDRVQSLRKDSSLFLQSFCFTRQMDRHGHLDLLTTSKSAKIRVDQAALNRIDLEVTKDHVVVVLTIDIDRKHRINARIGTKDRRKILELGYRRNALSSPA